MEMDGEWTVTAPRIEIGEKAKIFAPANMRAAQSLPGYKAQIEDWMTRKLTLRSARASSNFVQICGLLPSLLLQTDFFRFLK